MKTLAGLGLAVILGLVLVSPARAEFVTNGDFGSWAYYWGMENGARFDNSWGNPAFSGLLQMGDSVIWQTVNASQLPADADFQISLDGYTWSKAVGDPGLRVQMVYYHTGGAVTSEQILAIEPSQMPDGAWANFTSNTFTTPSDLDYAKVWITKYNMVGGWVSVDNVAGTIVPEPATLGLLSLGGLFLRRRSK